LLQNNFDTLAYANPSPLREFLIGYFINLDGH
jgi:hypothetical protein